MFLPINYESGGTIIELLASSNILSGRIFSAISGSSISVFLSFYKTMFFSSSYKNGMESFPPDLLCSPLNVLEGLLPDHLELGFLASSLGLEFLLLF